MRRFLPFLALLALPVIGLCQRVLPSTEFTRDLLRSEDAISARAKLGVGTNGVVFNFLNEEADALEVLTNLTVAGVITGDGSGLTNLPGGSGGLTNTTEVTGGVDVAGDVVGVGANHPVHRIISQPWAWASLADLTDYEVGDSVTNLGSTTVKFHNATGGTTNWIPPIVVRDSNGRKALGFFGTNVLTSTANLPTAADTNCTIFLVVECQTNEAGVIIGKDATSSTGQFRFWAGNASYSALSGFYTFRAAYGTTFTEADMPRLDWPHSPFTNRQAYVLGMRWAITNTTAEGPLGFGQWHSINSTVLPYTRSNYLTWAGTPLVAGMLATSSAASPFDGSISEIIVYTNALSMDEYQTVMDGLVALHTKRTEQYIYWGSDSIFGGADMGAEEKNVSPGGPKTKWAMPFTDMLFNDGTTRTIDMELSQIPVSSILTGDPTPSRPRYSALWTIGSDDLYNGSNVLATVERYFTLLGNMRNRGWRTYAATLIPREPDGTTGAQFETDRLLFNQLVRDNWGLYADGLIDLTLIPWLSYGDAYTNSTYYIQAASNVGSPNTWAQNLLSKYIAQSFQRGGSAIGGTNVHSPQLYRRLNADGTLLTLSAVADGEFLKRDGANVVGAAGTGGGFSNPATTNLDMAGFSITNANRVSLGFNVTNQVTLDTMAEDGALIIRNDVDSKDLVIHPDGDDVARIYSNLGINTVDFGHMAVTNIDLLIARRFVAEDGAAVWDPGEGSTAAAFSYTTQSISYDGTNLLDFATTGLASLSLTGDSVFTTTNLASGKNMTIRILSDGSTRNFTFPSGWVFLGSAAPASIAASKTAVLTLTAFGTNDSDVVAGYSVEP